MSSLIHPDQFRKNLSDYKAQNPDKKRKIDASLQRELNHGWLLDYLIPMESMVWGRWAYWIWINQYQKLPNEDIPQIEFNCGKTSSAEGAGSLAMNHLEECLDLIANHGHGGWRSFGGSKYVEYFLDWLLYGFGYHDQVSLPPEPTKGASMRLYQYFDLSYLVAYPWDYWGYLFCEMSIGKGAGFFPTPHPVVWMMSQMAMGDIAKDGVDARLQTVNDPCLGTGRMLLYASNHCLRGYGADINPMCVKASLINFYLYAPWFARPLKAVDTLAEEAETFLGVSLEIEGLIKSLRSIVDKKSLSVASVSGVIDAYFVKDINWLSVV